MSAAQPARRNRRPKKRELFCPAHPEQRIQGNGKKYFLHLLQPEQLQQRDRSRRGWKGLYPRKVHLEVGIVRRVVEDHVGLEPIWLPWHPPHDKGVSVCLSACAASQPTPCRTRRCMAAPEVTCSFLSYGEVMNTVNCRHGFGVWSLGRVRDGNEKDSSLSSNGPAVAAR